MPDPETAANLSRLDDLIAKLRAPDGCPWDQKQTLPDLRAYLLEEAHELADAIDRSDANDLREELGDLLFQAAFIGRLASEAGLFELCDAIEAVEKKMIDRHPHVFGDTSLADSAAVEAAWEKRKLSETDGRRSALAGVPQTLPALLHSYRVGQKAGALGFDWKNHEQVLDKIREELAEVEEALGEPSSASRTEPSERVQDEIGDLLLATANLARHLGIDPEAALVGANRKFQGRFERMEELASERQLEVSQLQSDAWEELWDEAKAEQASRSEPDR